MRTEQERKKTEERTIYQLFIIPRRLDTVPHGQAVLPAHLFGRLLAGF